MQREMESYIGSDRHFDNLRIARLCASNLKFTCRYCGKVVASCGIRQHEVACIKTKKCPVCEKHFLGHGTTCSYGCANTYFRTGSNHGNWKPDKYRNACFRLHQRSCVICKEENIIEVHHSDENHNNDNPDNLVPLCPTHHQYWHSKFRHMVEPIIMLYLETWNIEQRMVDPDVQIVSS